MFAALDYYPNSKVLGTNMGPTRVLSAQGGSHVGPMNLAIWVLRLIAPDHFESLYKTISLADFAVGCASENLPVVVDEAVTWQGILGKHGYFLCPWQQPSDWTANGWETRDGHEWLGTAFLI